MVLFYCVIKLSLFKGDEVHCDKAKVEHTAVYMPFYTFNLFFLVLFFDCGEDYL